MNNDPVLIRDEAAALLKISTRQIDRMVADGLLPVVRLGSSVRFLRADIDAFLESARVRRDRAAWMAAPDRLSGNVRALARQGAGRLAASLNRGQTPHTAPAGPTPPTRPAGARRTG